MNTLRATLAGVGAYYLVAAVVLTVLGPVRYSLPRYGSISYDPLLTILAAMTFVGVTAGALVAYACGGQRALAITAALQAAAAASAVLPLIGQRALWAVPSDLVGITPATALLISHLVAVPALLLALALAVLVRRRQTPHALEGAGVYYLSAVALSLPTPQLDVRLTLPFAAQLLPDVWHAATTAVPAVIAATWLSAGTRSIWRASLLVGLFALAGAGPGEISMLALNVSPYLPVSLIAVPALSAALAAGVVIARRTLVRRASLRSARLRSASLRSVSAARPMAAVGGAAAALMAVGAWAVFAGMPVPSDRVGPVETYMRTGDERKLVVCVLSGRGEEVLGAAASESAQTVTVAVRLRRAPSWYFHDLVGIPLPVVVTLRDPLGGRTLIDQWSGRAVREVERASPGRSPWC